MQQVQVVHAAVTISLWSKHQINCTNNKCGTIFNCNREQLIYFYSNHLFCGWLSFKALPQKVPSYIFLHSHIFKTKDSKYVTMVDDFNESLTMFLQLVVLHITFLYVSIQFITLIDPPRR